MGRTRTTSRVRLSHPPTYTPVVEWHTVPVLMSMAQVANLLCTTPDTVRKRIAEGKLPARMVNNEWRIRKEHLMEFLGYLPWEIDKYGFGLDVQRPH